MPTLRPSIRLAAIALAAAGIGAGLLLPTAAAAADKKQREQIEQLPEKYQQWLDTVDLLITDEELESFLAIEEDYQRDAFIDRFWRTRDPYPDTARNEFKDRWDERVSEAMVRFGDITGWRSKVMLLNGLPDALVTIDCPDLHPAEVWWYQYAENIGGKLALLFYRRFGGGRWEIWQPTDGADALLRFPDFRNSQAQLYEAVNGCHEPASSALRAVFSFVQQAGGVLGYQSLVAQVDIKPKGPSGEWVQTFHAYSTDLPADAATFDATLALAFPGRRQNRTIVQAVVSVDKSQVEEASFGDANTYNLLATGEILKDDSLFENFRYRFNFDEGEIPGQQIPLVMERALRPGNYVLLLKLEDLNGKRFHRLRAELDVPEVDRQPPPEPEDPETRRILEEANAMISSDADTIEIVPPFGELQAGLLRVDTLTTGHDIATVVFRLDGGTEITKRRPPFSVELDLGNLPRLRHLTAIAYDAQMHELARDEMALNASTHRFDVQLVSPVPGLRYDRSLRAEANVHVPEDKAIDRVEFFLNEKLVATLYQPPFTQTILLPPDGRLAYVRAVAYQADGNSTEDLVYVNAPDYLEEVDIQFVELYIAVLDQQSHPVTGLPLDAFQVSEDGTPQTPVRFDEVSNLPIHAGILLDISASMEERLDVAREAALRFFEQAISPRDRATLVTFNDHPSIAVKFTNDLKTLAGGLAGLKAERGTALYDCLIFALHYFNGIKGQRALILLSDGEDEHSKFTFDDALEYARRAGVAIYTIGVDLPRGPGRKELTRFAEETGGRSFLIDDVSELASIYDAIQKELRSRYYLAYQSTNTSPEDRFRTIDVAVDGKGLEAKTLRGYYP